MRKDRRFEAALAGLQQLCGTGLTSEMAIPALLQTLPDWLDVDGAQFFWVDAQLRPVDYCGHPPLLNAAEDFTRRCENLHLTDIATYSAFLREHASLVCGGPEDRSYYRSAMYNEVFRPVGGAECLLSLVIRDDRGQVRGSLSLGRERRASPFTTQERHQGEMLARHFSALFVPSAASDESGESLERCAAQGMALLDRSGRPLYCDDIARELLVLAGHADFRPHSLLPPHADHLAARLRQLCATLENIFAGRPSPPPAVSLRLAAGRFVFRARRLGMVRAAATDLVGLDIAHYLPRRLVSWRRLQQLDLPLRLQQIGLEFAEGRSMTQIAAQFGISRHTVIDHVNRIYARLGLEPGREALQAYLQEPP